MFGERPLSDSRDQPRARSRSYRATSGMPHCGQRKWRPRGSSFVDPQGTEHSRWVNRDMREVSSNKSQVTILATCYLLLVTCHLLLAAEKFRVFLLLQLVDLLDVAVGEPLDLVEPLALVVFGDLVVLEQFLEAIVRVATDAPDGVASLFRELVHVTRQLLAAFFGQRRDRNAHDLAVV